MNVDMDIDSDMAVSIDLGSLKRALWGLGLI